MSGEASSARPIAIAWRVLHSPGHDAATLSRTSDGWRLEGAAAFVHQGVPCHLGYRIALGADWHTRSADIRGWVGAMEVERRLRVTPDREWTLDDAPVQGVRGCIDVDLAFTPATNLLPIRRLALAVGASAPIVAAWLRFPELDLVPLDQVYLRSAERSYRYSSRGGSFQSTLSVSPDGFVVDYPGLWIEEKG